MSDEDDFELAHTVSKVDDVRLDAIEQAVEDWLDAHPMFNSWSSSRWLVSLAVVEYLLNVSGLTQYEDLDGKTNPMPDPNGYSSEETEVVDEEVEVDDDGLLHEEP